MTKLELVKIAAIKTLGRNGLLLRKYSPELLIGMGIAGIVASTIMACKATLKLEGTIIYAQDQIGAIKYAERNVDAPENNYKKDLALAYGRSAVELVKLYGPSVAMGTASIACILGSHNIMKGRNLALVAAYKTIEQGFNNYRQQVIDEFGEGKDHQYRYGITEEEVTETEKDETTGKSKKVKKTLETTDPEKISQYARFFDEYNTNWSSNAEYNLAFLKCHQNFANDRLRAQGHLFLNEVYDMLGFERTQAGQVVGWVINKNGERDNYVDFGIYDTNSPQARKFVNGAERSILLNFNVDGIVYDQI